MKIDPIKEHLRCLFLYFVAMPVLGLSLGSLAGIIGSSILYYFEMMTYEEGKMITFYLALGIFLITFFGAIPIYLSHLKTVQKLNRHRTDEQDTAEN